jgi:hypothetical protein
MNFSDAKAQARAFSIDNRCTVNVNRRADGTYLTSDWYADSVTVMQYTNGEANPFYPEIAETAHDWYHSPDIYHHLVCLKCGLGWHDIKDMSAIVHKTIRMEGHNATLVECGSYKHSGHYDKCCERDNTCIDPTTLWTVPAMEREDRG